MSINAEPGSPQLTIAILEEIGRMQSQKIERLERQIAELDGSARRPKEGQKKRKTSNLKLIHGGKE